MVCQNQSIDDSEAPLARDLRLLVRERLTAGDSDRQVLDFMVARYGEFVLLRPPFNWRTALLWLLGPLVLLAAGLALFRVARRSSPQPAPGEPAVAPLTEYVRHLASPSIAGARPDGDDLPGRWGVLCFVATPATWGLGLTPDCVVAYRLDDGTPGTGADEPVVLNLLRRDSGRRVQRGWCQGRMFRSGCGIRPKTRPVGSQTPATPSAEPLGLAGNDSAGRPESSR